MRVGFVGDYKVGDWTPLQVMVTSSEPTRAVLWIDAPDADDNLVHYPSAEFELSPGAPKRVEGCFRTGRVSGDLHLRLTSGERTLATTHLRAEANHEILRPAFTQAVALWATLGKPMGSEPGQKPDEVQSRQRKTAALASAAELPSDHAGYESLEVLIVAGGAQAEGTGLEIARLTAAQNAALRGWVQNGGHVFVAVGSNVDEFAKTPLGQWLPLKILGETRLRQLSEMESYAGRAGPVRFDGSVSSARIELPEGRVLIQGLDGPLLVQAPYGFGRVTFLALDLDRAPLANWEGLNMFYRRLLTDDLQPGRQRQRSESAQLAQLGVTDLGSQLQFALEHFPSVSRPSMFGVLGWLLLYLVLIGPLDYLLVHRVLKRPEWTWFTLPLLVIGAAALSVTSATWANGTQLRANEFDLLDVDVASKSLRGHNWTTLYSPASRHYDAAVAATSLGDNPKPVDSPRVTWNSVPENVIGGLYRPSGLQLTRREYSSEPEGLALRDLPVATWSTKGLTAEWSGPAESPVEANLESNRFGRLSGSLSHHLPGAIEDCFLAYGNRVFFPPARWSNGTRVVELAPHQPWELGHGDQRELRNFLTKVVSVSKEGKVGKEVIQQQTPYDPLNREPADLLRMITFYQAAGGLNYTGLRDDVWSELDLSQHLKLGRAVLFGRLAHPVAEIQVDGHPVDALERDTFVRLVIPVRLTNAEELLELPDPDEGLPK
ncbi:MAG TPA: hypothetical protein VHB77_08445 [Planctomycetaceae bacterium]|nr:hypothetical protein [Planctomycetaceae bacterium]